ncbi:MAG: succinate dehydrogenase assembly factor 2 [Hyphomicrobiaceae bacterium]|nr:succinate dehydrogenase assembly factor 2 [Hyphomicrobiaceae bacterium]
MNDLETSRRRAAYRAAHRGTKEMDILLGRFAAEHLPAMDTAELARFERFLSVPDPELQAAILSGDRQQATEFADLVAAIRSHHGLPGERPRD